MTPRYIREAIAAGVITLILSVVVLVIKYGPVIHRETVGSDERKAQQ